MATTPKPISGLTSAAAARVVLWQSREFVTVPGNAMGLQATLPATGLLPGTIGSTGKILSVVGGVPAWVEPASEFIALASFNSPAASVSFTNLSAYREMRLRGWCTVATSAAQPFLRTSVNNGSSYDAGATDYFSQYLVAVGPTPAAARLDMAHFPLLAGVGMNNGSTLGIIFDVQFEEWNTTNAVGLMRVNSGWLGSDGNTCNAHIYGGRNSVSSPKDAFQVICSGGGNFSKGHFRLEGIRG